MRNNLYLLSILVLGLTLGGCGGGGGGGGTDDPIADITGTWDITETLGSNTCDDFGTTTYTLTATLSGNDVTVVTPVGTFTGTLDGDQLEWSGRYPEDGGTVTITDMDITVSADGNTLSGTTRWSWTDGSFSCSGTTNVSGVRTSAPPPPGGGNTCGTVTDISANSSTAGNLETSDCRIEDMFPGSGDTTYVDEYRVTLSSGGTLTITMRSSEVDAFLALVNFASSCTDASCTPTQVETFDDDSGGGVNGVDAQISVFLNAGTYIIFANSFDVETGSYTLQTTFP